MARQITLAEFEDYWLRGLLSDIIEVGAQVFAKYEPARQEVGVTDPVEIVYVVSP